MKATNTNKGPDSGRHGTTWAGRVHRALRRAGIGLPSDWRPALATTDIGCLSRDLGVPRDDLGAGPVRRHQPVWLLPAMMRRFEVEPESLGGAERAAYHDMLRVCSRCPVGERCRRALAAGDDARECRRFCYNTATLDALAVDRHR